MVLPQRQGAGHKTHILMYLCKGQYYRVEHNKNSIQREDEGLTMSYLHNPRT